MTRLLPPPSPHHRRRGFTLIEVLVVITILAILAAFLVPALSGASLRARIVQVRTDISAIESAIGQFKTDFNMEPPSGIVLYERGEDANNNGNITNDPAPNWGYDNRGPAYETQRTRSRAIIRQLWPQFDFRLNRDINRNGDPTESFDLRGSESLVLFLGGAIGYDDTNSNSQRDPGEKAYLAGFSKNPANPFAADGNRQGPYFEFRNDRLSESTVNTGFFVYRDPWPSQTNPYMYVSSYGGKGYRQLDLGMGGLQHWYLQGTAATSQPWLATKYQIISPGPDGQYGVGGPFQPTQSVALPAWNRTTPAGSWTVADRAPEADNITNFHSGRLSDK